MESPTVGRIIHYVAYGTPGGEFPAGVCRAAIITGVESETKISLCVFNPSGLFFNHSIDYDEDKESGSWHWPERK